MNNCIGIINLDENDQKINELTRHRTLASLPIAGRYRVIDFVLSNMTNSGVESIGLFTKNKSRSLMDHLTNGRPWDSSYMICNINYNEVLDYHREQENDITIVYKNVKDCKENFTDCEVLNLNEDSRVISIGENISYRSNSNINMEMYIMKKSLFIDIIYKSIKSGMYRKVKHYISDNISNLKVGGYEFKGYLACVNSIKSYYDANMDFLAKNYFIVILLYIQNLKMNVQHNIQKIVQ